MSSMTVTSSPTMISTPSSPTVSSSISTMTSSATMSSTPLTPTVSSSNSAWTSLLVPTTTSYSGSARTIQAQASYRSRLPILAHRDPVSADYWGPSAELGGRIIYLSNKDGKPRITNINGGRKLRVGIWSHLDDPV